jgi:hypothetical protein
MIVGALGLIALGLFLGRDLLAPRPALGQTVVAEESIAAGAWSGAKRAKGPREEDKHILTTAGTGAVRFKPDSARVFLRVDSQAPTIQSARAQNNKDVKQVIDALKGLQIPNLKMKSDNITVTQVFERRDSPITDRLPKVLGYVVHYHFTALVENEDPAKLSEYAGQVLDTALAHGANNLQQVLIFRKDQTAFRRQALTRAVEDALANARALAAGAHQTIQATTAISGEPQYVYFNYNTRLQNSIQQAVPEGENTPVMAGELEISCRVSLTCRY